MAKAAQRQEVAEQQQAGLPMNIADRIKADAGKGVSQKREDNLIPMVYVLQDGSPQAKERDPAHIKGAKPGSLWLRGANIVVPGDQGIIVQPCAFQRAIIEWVPRESGGGGGAGFVARHNEMPANAVEKPDPKDPKKTQFILPNGNHCVDTRYHFVMINGMAYVIPMSSTAHTISRGWTTLMNNQRKWGDPDPSFAHFYKITSQERKNNKGTWFTWRIEYDHDIESEGDRATDLYEKADGFYRAVMAGEKKAEDEDGGAHSGESETSESAQANL